MDLYDLSQRFSECDPWMKPCFSGGTFLTGRGVTNASFRVPPQIFSSLSVQTSLPGDSDPSSSLQTAALGPAHHGFGALVTFCVGERAQQTNNCLTDEEVKIEARAVQEPTLQTDCVLDLGSRPFGM